jgi:hypothetical protein
MNNLHNLFAGAAALAAVTVAGHAHAMDYKYTVVKDTVIVDANGIIDYDEVKLLEK